MSDSTVIINGKRYDAVTGLPREDVHARAPWRTKPQAAPLSRQASVKKTPSAKSIPTASQAKPPRAKRVSKQARLAAAVAAEFAEPARPAAEPLK
jgi:hypothetical protein